MMRNEMKLLLQIRSNDSNLATVWRTNNHDSICSRDKGFFFPPKYQTSSGAYPASYSTDNYGSPHKCKQPGYNADHTPPSSYKGNKEYTFTLSHACKACTGTTLLYFLCH